MCAAQLGALIGADPADLALVPNATVAVNTVLRSLWISDPSDEILTSPTTNTTRASTPSTSSPSARAPWSDQAIIPYPLTDPSQVVDAITYASSDLAHPPRARVSCHEHHRDRLSDRTDRRPAPGSRASTCSSTAPMAPPCSISTWTPWGPRTTPQLATNGSCSPKGTGYLHVRRDKQARDPTARHLAWHE